MVAPVWEFGLPALGVILLPLVQGSVCDMVEWSPFELKDIEALVTVAREAKEWMATHHLKR
jgi:hypothetical protein